MGLLKEFIIHSPLNSEAESNDWIPLSPIDPVMIIRESFDTITHPLTPGKIMDVHNPIISKMPDNGVNGDYITTSPSLSWKTGNINGKLILLMSRISSFVIHFTFYILLCTVKKA